jgi:hypothetical protein
MAETHALFNHCTALIKLPIFNILNLTVPILFCEISGVLRIRGFTLSRNNEKNFSHI